MLGVQGGADFREAGHAETFDAEQVGGSVLGEAVQCGDAETVQAVKRLILAGSALRGPQVLDGRGHGSAVPVN